MVSPLHISQNFSPLTHHQTPQIHPLSMLAVTHSWKKKRQGTELLLYRLLGSGIACWIPLERLSLSMLLRGTSRPTFILWFLIVFNLFFYF
ncbi:hypothetical protein LDENG_00249740 [Lucifuga dentata]|nr:hypothetical protein LDENG_00249740 [Lucifuga dentata]